MKTVFMIGAGCVCNIMIAAVFGSFGTYVPYIMGYLRKYQPKLQYSDIALLVALNNVAFNTLSWCSGFMIKSLGIKQTAAGASMCLAISTAACYYALQNYWTFTILTSAVSFFSAIIQATIIVVCMEWGKRHKGTAVGIISFSESIGSTLFSIIGTAVINPNNLPVNKDTGYFDQDEILSRIPLYFLCLGVGTLVILLPTSLFISLPDEEDEREEETGEFLIEESDDTAFVRSVIDLNPDIEHTPIPGYKLIRQIRISESQPHSSYRSHQREVRIEDETFEEEPKIEDPDDDSAGWVDLFRSVDFYYISIVYSVAKICRTMLYTYYKAYGLTVIQSDQFLTMVAVVSNFVNAIGRLIWGALSDRIRSKYLILSAAVLGAGAVEATYWCLYSPFSPDILYMLSICLDSVIFASQILFTTCLYTYFGKKDFGVKYGLVRAGPGLAVLAFSFLLKYVNIFTDWNTIYHSMACLCMVSALISTLLTNHPLTQFK